MPAVDIDKKPEWMTKRPSALFLILAGFAAGAYIALNSPAANSAPAVATPAPAVKKCHAATAEKPVHSHTTYTNLS